VIVRARIRKVDGEPHQLSDSYFPRWLTDEHPEFLQPGDISRPGGLLAAAGLTQVRFYDQITARMPDSDEARTLRMSSGTPLLIHSRTGYDEKDRPVRHMITRAAADRVEISYALDA
jgi:GntR family transcriptional regulator